MKLCAAAFEGGGVKGIGLAGAAAALMQSGYGFYHLAGTSAGAIVAALLAAGFSAQELKETMQSVDYTKFRQTDWKHNFGLVGTLVNIGIDFGIYSADNFEEWMRVQLLKKNVSTFADLKNADGSYRLHVTASDLSCKKLLVFPDDLEHFGVKKDTFPVARAVRMSMSIPIYFEPTVLKDNSGIPHYIVDGGLLSNYPMWILDDGKTAPTYPAFGFKFSEKPSADLHAREGSAFNLVDYLKAIVSTALEAHDKLYITKSNGDLARSILIPTDIADGDGEKIYIETTDFDITPSQCDLLYQNGATAAQRFLSGWNFEEWTEKYRSAQPS